MTPKRLLFATAVAALVAVAPHTSSSMGFWRPNPPAAPSGSFLFEDGFENANTALDLLKADGSRWTNLQKTLTENAIDISKTQFVGGAQSVRFYARNSVDPVSKADLEKEVSPGVNNLAKAGNTVSLSASFFIPAGPALQDVFIFDLECGSCWGSTSLPNKSPGIRIQLKGSGGVPIVERGKIGQTSYTNATGSLQPMPRGKWARLEWRTKLAIDATGVTEILIDGVTVFRATGPNLPDPAVFETYGVELTRSAYDRFQVGLTANGSSNPVEIFVDDVKLAVTP